MICVLFLFHFRSALVVVFSLPLGILVAFIVMYQQGLNANIMSLGGLALGVGMLVDNAIVVLESITRCREEGDS